jgi:hypothetical protein
MGITEDNKKVNKIIGGSGIDDRYTKNNDKTGFVKGVTGVDNDIDKEDI